MLLKVKGSSIHKMPTIKFFVDKKRMAAEKFKNEEFYPLYMRITFLRRGTMLKVLDRSSQTIFLTSDTLEKIKLNWSKGLSNYLYRYLLEKTGLVISIVQQEYQISKERFDFKEFTRKFKVLEKYIFPLLYEHFLESVKRITEERVDDFALFNDIDFNLIARNERETYRWIKLVTDHEDLPEHLLLLGQTMIAYHFYECLTNMQTIGGFRVHNGTIYHWLYSFDLRGFEEKKREANEKALLIKDESAFFSKKMTEIFAPDIEKYTDYQEIISKLIREEGAFS